MKKNLLFLFLVLSIIIPNSFSQGTKTNISVKPTEKTTVFDGSFHTLSTDVADIHITAGALNAGDAIISVSMDSAYILPGAYAVKVKNILIRDDHGVDVTDNYNVTKVSESLTIKNREEAEKYLIQPQTNGANQTYNGALQQVNGFVSNTFLVAGHTYTLSGLTAHAEGINVGTYIDSCYGVPVVTLDTLGLHLDVTSQFKVEPSLQALVIAQCPLTITKDSTRMYDGNIFTIDYTNVTAALVPGDVLTSGEIQTSSANVGTYTLSATTTRIVTPFTTANGIENYFVTYDFIQNITALSVNDTVKCSYYKGNYDGTTHNVNGFTHNFNSTLYNESYMTQPDPTSITASRMVVGTTYMGLRPSQFNNLNHNFDVRFIIQDGYVEIDKIGPIEITTSSDEKTFDGDSLKNPSYLRTGTILSGDSLIVKVTGGILNAGKTYNTIESYKVMHDALDVTDCYTFSSINLGQLKINPVDIYIKTADSTKMYDGTPLTAPYFDITSGSYVGTDTMIPDFSSTFIIEKGQTLNSYEPVFSVGAIAENYKLHNTYGILKVNDSLRVSYMLFEIPCHGGTTSANVYPKIGNEGVPPYQYKIDGGSWQPMTGSNVRVDDMHANVSYTVGMKDAIGVTDFVTITPTDPPLLKIDTFIVTNSDCAESNGGAQAIVSGGRPVDGRYYFYHWSTGDSTPSVSGLAVGNYSLTINDYNGCSVVKDFEIEVGRNIDVTSVYSDQTCKKSGSFCVTPYGNYVPTGTLYNYGAPEIIPAAAVGQVTGFSSGGIDQTVVCTGNVTNNYPGTVTVRYTVTPHHPSCGNGHTFTVELRLGGSDLPAEGIGISPQPMSTCSHHEIDTSLTVKLSALRDEFNYPITWSTPMGVVHTVAHQGDTVAQCPITIPDTCYEKYYYGFSITDKSGCTHTATGVYVVSPGTWTVPASPDVQTVACPEQAEAPHLRGVVPDVISDCGETIPYTYSTYAMGSTCDMYIYHLYRYADCSGYSAGTINYVYHVKDTISPTTREDYPRTVHASVYECEFSVPSLIDSVLPIYDNCTGGFLYYNQIPGPGTVITQNTQVVLDITDRCGNKVSDTIMVIIDDTLKFRITKYDSQCYNVNDGYIEGEITGGVSPYNIIWKTALENGAKQQDTTGTFRFENMADGIYDIYASCGNGCKTQDTIRVNLQDIDDEFIVTAKSGTHVYDGTAYSLDDYELTGTLRTIEGVKDTIIVVVSGDITNVGSTANVVTSAKILRRGNDVTCEYNLAKVNGLLSVTKRKVTLKSGDATKNYDGTPLTNHSVSVVEGSFVPGEDTASCNVFGTRTLYGREENDFDYTLNPAADPANYEITKQYGVLEVKKALNPIEIKADDSTKIYDCTDLMQAGYTYTGTLFPGDSLIATTTGSQTLVGIGYNAIATYKIMRGIEDVTNCYSILPTRIGVLQVNPRPITLQPGSKLGIPYDGSSHTWEEIPLPNYTLTDGTLASCDHFDTVPLMGSGTLVGDHPVNIRLSSLVIADGADNDRTNNYNFTLLDGNIQIIPRSVPYPIVLIAHSDTVDYTGAPQTCSGYDTVIVNGKVYPWSHSSDLHFELINENGDTINYRMEGVTTSVTKTNAGGYPVNIVGTPIIYDDGNHDVTSQFSVTKIPGNFVIKRLGILVIHITDSKTYDSDTLITAWNHSNTYAEGLGSSDHLSRGTMATNSPAIGNYSYDDGTPGVANYSHVRDTFNTTSGINNYAGVSYVVDQKITTGTIMELTCPSGTSITKVYDGTELRPSASVNAPVHDGTLATITYRSSTDGISWTSWTNVIPAITHVNDGPLQVEVKAEHPYYQTKYCNYTLTVTRRPVKFTTPSVYQEYDQTDLTSTTVSVGGDGFATATSEGTDVCTATGVIRNVDTVDNPLNYALKSNTNPSDYIFDTIIGKLGVWPRPVTIKSCDSTRAYIAGQPVTKDSAKVISVKGFLGGDTVSYNFTGTQTIPGLSPNYFTLNGFTHGTDATSTQNNYNITLEYGTLKVLENYDIVVASQNDTFQYDGLAHVSDRFTVKLNGTLMPVVPSSGGLQFYVYGDQNILTITPTANITNVSECGRTSTFTYTITHAGQPIEECYNVTKLDTGKLYVLPIPLTITVNDTKEYDKTPLSTAWNSSHLTTVGLATTGGANDHLAAGAITTDMDTVHTYTYNATPDGIHSTVTTPFVIKNVSNEEVNGNYIISYVATQTITPSNNYVLTCPSGTSIEKVYDGTALAPTAVVTGQEAGDVLKIEYSINGGAWSTTVPSITHVVENIATIDVRASHHDYDTLSCSYSLTINKRNVKPTSPTDTKVYDNIALTNDAVTTPTTGICLPWVSGEEATYDVRGTQTLVGTSNNIFDFTWNAGADPNDYIVKLDTGTLTVTPSPNLKVYCPGTISNPVAVTQTYDGTLLNPAATFNTTGLYGTDASSVVIEYKHGSGAWSTTPPGIEHYVDGNAGAPYTVEVRATHHDYTTSNCSYDLTISKRNITTLSASDTMVYDGTPLQAQSYKVTVGSFVPGDSMLAIKYASRTHLGDSSNLYDLTPNAGTDMNDYNVTRQYGHLVITASPAAVLYCPGTTENPQAITKKYDATALSPTAIASGIGLDVVPVQYATSMSGPWQNDPISITNVGSQTVYARTNNPDYQVKECSYVLTDTCRHITLASQDSIREYNSTALVAKRITVGGDGFVPGQTFTYDSFATLTHVDTIMNTFNYSDGTASVSNYCIDEVNYGKIGIYRSDDRTLTCPSGADIVKMYDGSALAPSATIADQYAGDVFTIEYSIDGGAWSTTVPSITHVDENITTVDVRAIHSDYDTATCAYSLTITPRPVKLISATDEKVYDKTALINHTVTVSTEAGYYDWVAADHKTYTVTGTQTEVGQSKNNFTYTIDLPSHVTDYVVSLDTGILKVKRATTLDLICPTGSDITKMYDGIPLNPAADTTGLYGDDKALIEYSTDGGSHWSTTQPSITHVGTQAVKVRATNPNYETDSCDYTLTVDCRHITLTSGTQTRTYDATTWDYQSVVISGDGLAAGEHIDSTNFASIKDVGSKPNTFSYTFKSPALASDYCVDDTIYGTLTVTKADITLNCPITTDAEKVYDGAPLHPVATASGVGSDVITVEYSTNAGTSWSTTEPAITNVGTQDVMVMASNPNYYSDTCYYTLKITPNTDPVVVEVVGHHQIFDWDGTEHIVTGYDTTCANVLYAAVMDTSFTFTGSDTVKRTDVGRQDMGLLVSQYSNHNPNFTNVTFVVTDGWIEVKDVTKPYFIIGCSNIGDQIVLPNMTLNRYQHSGTSWNVTAADNIGVDSLYYTLSGATVLTVPTSDNATLDGQIFNYGITYVKWVAKDAAGNDTTCVYTVKVEDATPPVVNCPKDTMYMCNGDVPAGATTYAQFVAQGGSATDNVGIVESTFRLNESSDHNRCPETIQRTYSIKDEAGNEGSCTQTIIVHDTVKPSFTVPADTQICRDPATGNIVATVTVTGIMRDTADNCTPVADLTVAWIDIDTTNTDKDIRVIHRQWTLTDECGNMVSKTQSISVKPSIMTPGNFEVVCPNDTVVTLAYGDCDTAILLPSPAFVNRMHGTTVVVGKDYPDGYRYGAETTTMVTWTFEDDCGAKKYCYQNVTVHYPPCGGVLDSVEDFDHYKYSSVRIGCNCWTGENLRSTHYTNGDTIPGNWRYYDDDELEEKYGKLYSWYSAAKVPEGDDSAVPTVNPKGYVQGICPEGWALPTVREYELLVSDAHGVDYLKDLAPGYWLPGHEGKEPNTGFKMRGAGCHTPDITYPYQNLLGETAFWAVDAFTSSSSAHCVWFSCFCDHAIEYEMSKKLGYSIRCIKKETIIH